MVHFKGMSFLAELYSWLAVSVTTWAVINPIGLFTQIVAIIQSKREKNPRVEGDSVFITLFCHCGYDDEKLEEEEIGDDCDSECYC